MTNGVFGSDYEPSAGIELSFADTDRDVVLAALAQFADNFNQDGIHVRQKAPARNEQGAKTRPGDKFSDGSYATLVYRWELSSALTKKKVSDIIDNSGLDGLTVGDGYVEAYFAGDAGNAKQIEAFVEGATWVEKSLGRRSRASKQSVERLYAYGRRDGDGQLGYDRIQGQLPQSGFSPKVARKIAAYVAMPKSERRKAPGKNLRETKSFDAISEVTEEHRAIEQKRAAEFSALPINDLKNLTVKRAYRALTKALLDQFDAMPIKVEMWHEGTEPYANSDEMRQDVRQNNHLYFLQTDVRNFGPPGVDFSGHPLLEDSGRTDVNGDPMSFNDVLRAVHDYFAHNMSAVVVK